MCIVGCSDASQVKFKGSPSKAENAQVVPALSSTPVETNVPSIGTSTSVTSIPTPTPTVQSTPAPMDPARSCLEIKSRTTVSTDGEYSIDLDGRLGSQPDFKVYCKDMNTANPVEYLTLTKTKATGFPSLNYSKSATGGTCTAAADYFLYVEKVRFNISTLEVDITDKTFTTDSGNKTSHINCVGFPATYWASVHNCKATYDASSISVIDLAGLPFKIASDQQWSATWRPNQSYLPGGNSTVSVDRKSATITGGGYCGGRSPMNNKVKLVFE